jgi:hypothetical protein
MGNERSNPFRFLINGQYKFGKLGEVEFLFHQVIDKGLFSLTNLGLVLVWVWFDFHRVGKYYC